MELFPIEQVREQFPALQRIEQDYFVAYFDGPSNTQIAKNVIDAMGNYMKTGVANPGGVYKTTRETSIILSQAREYTATFLGTTKEHIIFGPNMMTLAYQIARMVSRDWRFGEGNIVITDLDEQPNRDPWTTIAREKEMRVHTIKIKDDTNELDVTNLNNIINKNTKLVAVSYASHLFGSNIALSSIIKRAKEVGALIALCAVHAVAHTPFYFDEMDIDFLFCSANRFYGPHIGIVAIKDNVLDGIKHIGSIDNMQQQMETETGAINFEGLIGVTEAIKFLSSLGEGNLIREKLLHAFEKIEPYENYLISRLKEGLKNIDGVTIFATKNNNKKIPIVSFQLANMEAKMVCYYLAQMNAIYVEYGNFDAEHLLDRLGITDGNIVRVGISLYNTVEEINRLIEAVKNLTEM